MDEQLENLFADLFAERIASLDTTDSEQIVIGDLKRYLGQRNYDNINLLLFQFYQYYDINISYEEICNVANNNMYFHIRNNYNNEEINNEEHNNEEHNNEEHNNEEHNNEEINNNLYNQPYNYIFRNINHYIFTNILDNNQNLEPNNNDNINNDNLNNNDNINININNDNLNDNININNDNININNDNINNNLNNNRIIYINNNFINRLNHFLHVDFNNNQQNQEYNDIPIPRLNSNLLLQAINIMLPSQNPAMLEPVAVALDDKCLEQLEEKVLDKKIDGMCMICFDEFYIEQTVLELPCDHFYHKDCIVPYFKEHSNKCPICRCEVGKSKPLL